jgi:hypothetical protein
VSTHDRCCPLDGPDIECTVCDAIAAARSEERATFRRVWADNIQPLTSRYYREGYQDATNGRPIAGWVS